MAKRFVPQVPEPDFLACVNALRRSQVALDSRLQKIVTANDQSARLVGSLKENSSLVDELKRELDERQKIVRDVQQAQQRIAGSRSVEEREMAQLMEQLSLVVVRGRTARILLAAVIGLTVGVIIGLVIAKGAEYGSPGLPVGHEPDRAPPVAAQQAEAPVSKKGVSTLGPAPVTDIVAPTARPMAGYPVIEPNPTPAPEILPGPPTGQAPAQQSRIDPERLVRPASIPRQPAPVTEQDVPDPEVVPEPPMVSPAPIVAEPVMEPVVVQPVTDRPILQSPVPPVSSEVEEVAIAEDSQEEVTKYVNTPTLRMRGGPGVDELVLAMLPKGTAVSVSLTEGDWSLIRTADGVQGWVADRYLQIQPLVE